MSNYETATDLLADFWCWRLENSPEFATFSGIHYFDDKLETYSIEAIQVRKVMCKKFLNDAQVILTKPGLTAEIQETVEYLIAELKTFLEGCKAQGYFFPLNYLEGPHVEIERLIAAMEFNTLQDFNKLLCRYKELPVQISQIIDIMKQGIGRNITFHKFSVAAIPEQIDLLDQLDVLQKNPEECVFYKPFMSLPDSIVDEEKEALLREAVESISHNVLPAFKMLKEFIENEYLNHVRPEIGVYCLPGGMEFYQMCLDFHLSCHMTPEEVHAMGLEEVKRISSDIKEVIKSLGLEVPVKDFFEKMRNDKSFYFKNSNELLDAYKGVVFKKIQPLLEKVFTTVPNCKLEIKPTALSMSGGPAAYYLAGTLDGKRPGVLYVNVANCSESAPKYDIITLALHEALPGHHLQFSYLLENAKIPPFRKYIEDRKYSVAPSRFPLHTAYLEGWGLYSEYLGYELGLYEDHYFNFGHLSCGMLRAARLVVDTGIHAFGWSFEKAVNYMLENTAISRTHIENEVKRYITWPGQACAYKVGELKLKSLRRMAEKELGSKFNVKEFHDLVLQSCGPLYLLEQKIINFIKVKKA